MPTPTVARILAPLVIVAWSSVSVSAQEWGAKMFDRTEIKFGSVARMADTTFKFKVTNPYKEEIRVSSLSTSCGCISWLEAGQTPISIPSKGERELTIRLDTIRHAGDKHVRAFVSLYEPTKGLTASITIPVEGRIRSDFEVSPSYVGFGTIDLGKGYTQRIGINYLGGRPDWKIVQAKTTNSLFTARIVEKSRSGGTVSYEALVEIDPLAPIGSLRDQLILTTNESGDSSISIPITANIEPDIVVTDVQFGSVTPGQPKSQNVIVRGKKPFTIARVDHVVRESAAKPTPDGATVAPPVMPLADAINVKVPTTMAPMQMLTVTLTPPVNSGVFEEEFSVIIEGRRQPLKFKAKGRIVGQEVTDVPK